MSIVNIPVGSKNADTLDGKHADEFAPSGFGLGTHCKYVTGDWNDYIETGFYSGNNLVNQPWQITSGSLYCYMLVIKHDSSWVMQMAFLFNSPREVYIRNKTGQTWTSWQKINDGGIADTIKNTLPIAKGGTGATSVVNALKNLNLLNNNLNSTPSCSALTYRDYTDFGLEPMNMFSFATLLTDYSTIIFSTSKYAKAYISDVPTDEGIILFTRGGLNHRVALFFSTANNNRGVVYQWSANSQILFQNWTKINDGGNALTLNNHEDSYFATAAQITTINTALNNKVDKITGKGLSTNDFTAAYKTKLDGIATGAKANVQSDWNVTATNSDAFIKNKPTSFPANGGNADTVDGKHASDFAQASQVTAINNTLNNKVDKVTGKNLSENDFTSLYKTKLDGIATGAKANVQSDWNVTATNSDAYIKNKPTSLPANGGNADTVDGKHVADFATAAQMTTVNTALNNKVDKVTGKGLSTNDFTVAYKTKLDGIANSADSNVQSDWNEKNTGSDAYIKNKPQNLVNKTELPTMCPQGFYKEYLSVSLESNSYYKIALDGYRSGNGIFVLDVVSDKSVIYESHVVFSVSSALDTFALDTIEATSRINVLTHGFNNPALNKLLICSEATQTTYLAIRTADFKLASPIDARIHINFIGREYKTYDTIEKVEIPQKRIVFELDL